MCDLWNDAISDDLSFSDLEWLSDIFSDTKHLSLSYCRDGRGPSPSQLFAAARRGGRYRYICRPAHRHPHRHWRVVLLHQQLRRHDGHLHATVWQVAGTQQGEDCWGGRKVRFLLPTKFVQSVNLPIFTTYLLRLLTLSQWRDLRMGVICEDLGALRTARAVEFWICIAG